MDFDSMGPVLDECPKKPELTSEEYFQSYQDIVELDAFSANEDDLDEAVDLIAVFRTAIAKREAGLYLAPQTQWLFALVLLAVEGLLCFYAVDFISIFVLPRGIHIAFVTMALVLIICGVTLFALKVVHRLMGYFTLRYRISQLEKWYLFAAREILYYDSEREFAELVAAE